jgi:inner membrane protein
VGGGSKKTWFSGFRFEKFLHGCAVEWITQAALGALIGELMMGKRLGKRALAWGAFFGTLPNLDVVLFPLLDTARELAWHRGPSHSLLVMALGTWGLSRVLPKLWKREKISQAEAGGLVAAAWGSHLLVDCLTVEGAALFWPISRQQVSFNLLHPSDFLVAIPLVAAVVGLTILPEPTMKKTRSKNTTPPSKRGRLCRWGLGLGAGYVALAIGFKWVASAGFAADLAQRGTKFERRMESPTPYNILLWRSVVDRGNELWVGYRSVFEFHSTPVRWTIYPKGREALAGVEDLRETKTLTRFTGGWWISRQHAKGAWLGDLRLPETRTWGSKKSMVDSRLADSWVINSAATGDGLRRISPEEDGTSEGLRRMAGRIMGNRENWEANPRLAGVPGSLPEFLAVEESLK